MREVAHVSFHVFEFMRLAFDLIARRLSQKSWAAFGVILIVIHEMVEA